MQTFLGLCHTFLKSLRPKESLGGVQVWIFLVPHSNVSTLTQVSASSFLGAKKSLLFNVSWIVAEGRKTTKSLAYYSVDGV